MKHMAKMGKTAVKKWVFRGKKWVFGVEKIRVGNHSRKAKWCKMQVFGQKTEISDEKHAFLNRKIAISTRNS